MTDFDKMIDVLRNGGVTESREVVVKTYHDGILGQRFTDICIGKNENGDWPDHIFSFAEDTEKLMHIWP